MDQRIQKLSSKTIGTFNPDQDSVNQFSESLLTLVEMYGEISVIAAIPAALDGWAKLWFRAHGMPSENMRSIDGWIDTLTDEFKVNTALAREKARLRKYNPWKDASVDEYYYEKLDLIRASEAGISPRRTVEELWLGLPADFQALLDYDEMMEKSVTNFGHALRTKDLSYREMKCRREDLLGRDRGDQLKRRNDRDDGIDNRRNDRHDSRCERGKEEGRGKGYRDNRDRERNKTDTKKGQGEKKRAGVKDDMLSQLPRDKWREDDKGHIMKRRCRFCDKWHMDFDCPSRPSSYSISAALDNQWHSSPNDLDTSGPEEELSESGSENSELNDSKRHWRTTKDIPMTYQNIFSQPPASRDPVSGMKLP